MAERAGVLINGRFLAQPLSGVQRYAREVVRALDAEIAADPALAAVRWSLAAPAGAAGPSLSRIAVERGPAVPSHAWDQLVLPAMARGRPLLNLGNLGPVLVRRQVVVIHDAAVQRHPEQFGRLYAAAHGLVARGVAGRARLATVSRFSQRELAAALRLPADTIAVAPGGADHFARVAPDPTAAARLGLAPGRFFLMLGNLAPHKNGALAVEALRRLGRAEARLVLVGDARGGVFASGSGPGEGAGAAVLAAGALGDAEVAGLMRGAAALVFPSRYEGFGAPPLEAMAQGCPVLASTAAAVRETCGEAAAFFDPDDPDALAALMAERLADSQARRVALAEAGRARAARFTWRAPARTLAGLCMALAEGR